MTVLGTSIEPQALVDVVIVAGATAALLHFWFRSSLYAYFKKRGTRWWRKPLTCVMCAALWTTVGLLVLLYTVDLAALRFVLMALAATALVLHGPSDRIWMTLDEE
jgi:hypothetical protein